MDENDPEPPSPHELLATARDDFAFFYANAMPDETSAMNGLVIRHAALVMLMNAPRGSEADAELERRTRELEQTFMEFRHRVQGSATYAALNPRQQSMIERVLFNVKVPDV